LSIVESSKFNFFRRALVIPMGADEVSLTELLDALDTNEFGDVKRMASRAGGPLPAPTVRDA
jgi:hypothetical protein